MRCFTTGLAWAQHHVPGSHRGHTSAHPHAPQHSCVSQAERQWTQKAGRAVQVPPKVRAELCSSTLKAVFLCPKHRAEAHFG